MLSIANLKQDPDRLLKQRDLCQLLEKSEAWAERQRWAGTGPGYIKLGRSVRYRAGDVLDWIEAQRVPTSARVSTDEN